MRQLLERRSFLSTSSIALLAVPIFAACKDEAKAADAKAPPAAPPAGAAPSKADAEANDVELLNGGILLEQAAIQVYTAAAGLEFIKSDAAVLKIAGQFMGHHEAHRDALIAFVEKLGGKPVDFAGAKTPEIPAIVLDAAAPEADRKTATLKFARKLEREAAEAYHTLIVQKLQTELARRGAVEILPVESMHVAIYDFVLGAEAPVNAALFSEQS
jgi:rubrerythrin